MCFVYHSCNYLRNILNIPLHFGRLKRYIADVSIIFERSQNNVIPDSFPVVIYVHLELP